MKRKADAKVGHKFADVDTNHPMAGKTLTFDIDIIKVRAADHGRAALDERRLSAG